MFGIVDIKIEPFEDSSDDEALIQYATRIKREPSPLMAQPFAAIKLEPGDYEPDFGDLVKAELTDSAEAGHHTSDRSGPSDGSEPPDASSRERTAKCDICGGFYRNKQGLSAHKKRVHFNQYLKKARRTGECAVCHKKYVNRKSLETHMNKMHLKDNGRGHQFKCEDCGQVFRIRNSLWMHRYYKHPSHDLRTACEYCPRVLKSPRSHKDHLKKKHPREYVSRVEAKPVGEEEAIVKVRPHQCQLCQKRYTSTTSLRKHAATVHPSPEDARDCPACKRQFKTEARLLTHLEAAHSGAADLRKCPLCGLIYKNKYSLQHHVHYTHGVRTPLESGTPCTPEEASHYTRRPHQAPLDDPLLPLVSAAAAAAARPQPEYILP